MSACQCGCQADISVRTPREVFTPPAHDAVAHRVGTHADFFATMLARLSSPAYRELAGLSVRTTDDPAIGLADASAVLDDLLTFYTERIANEGYLRTATLERSLELLGRLVGHQPRPGVAAGTYLSYTLEKDSRQGKDLLALIPRGSRAQSIPGPGEEPQAFESMEDLQARTSWNELKVRQRQPYQLTNKQLEDRKATHVKGVATNLKPGDRLLYVFGAEQGRQQLVEVSTVTIDREKDVTVIGKPDRTLPTLKGLRDDLLTLVTAKIDEAKEGNSVILQRFADDVLRELKDDLKDATKLTTAPELAKRLATDLERLDETLAMVARYPRLKEWLEDLREDLLEHLATARRLEPPPVEEPTLFEALALAETPSPPSSAVLGLGALLGSLRLPPARQPAGSRHLRRDPASLFAPGSDLGAQLLSALDPRIADGLYPAWRQLDLTAPPALQELLAMRIVATPFGSTAPLKPPDAPGGKPEEWDLEADQQLGITVRYDVTPPSGPAAAADPPKDNPVNASLVFTLGANAWNEDITDLGESDTIELGPGKAKYEQDNSGTVTFTFTEGVPNHRFTVSKVVGDEVTVKLDGTWQKPDFWNPGDPATVRLGPEDSFTRFQFDAMTQRWTTAVLKRVKEAPGSLPTVEITFAKKARIPANILTLDAVYDGIGHGSWVVIERPTKQKLPDKPDLKLVTARVTGARTVAKQAFGISGKVTELTLDRPWIDDADTRLSAIRDTTIYLRGDALALADEPVLTDVKDNKIEFSELYEGLTPGRWIIVAGDRTDIPGRPTGVPGTELAMIAGVEQGVAEKRPGDRVHTTITLAEPLAYTYRRETVHVFGNVVRATHGAGRDEPIGSGDEGKASQTFPLRQGPLTWLAADNPLGAASTLEVRVDGIRWHEVDSFAGRGPTERVFVTRPADNGGLHVVFGDGVRGSRLPTGIENVRARYRIGLGKAGNVAAGRITQLTTRPLGVSGVTNHLPAHGGADRDDASLLRRNIPLRVTAFDRLVSVPDHEDFARARAGIGRASARRLSNGARQIVHLTVAGADDIALQDDSDIVTTLRAALAAHGDSGLPVEVAVREPVLLVIAANIRVHPDHSWEIVEPAVRAALLARLGFRNRELAQPAYLSEVLATAQAVPGVDHVDVDVFTGVPGSITPLGLDDLAGKLGRPQTVVEARAATYDVTYYDVRDDEETLTSIAAKHGISVAVLLSLNPDITDTKPLKKGRKVVVFRGVRPAQLALLSPRVPDTLILKEVRP